MKKNEIILTILLFGAGVLSTAACSAAAPQNNTEIVSIPSNVAPVVVFEAPKGLDFAGEAVPLDNFDVRESYQEEMGVTMYMHSRTMSTLRASDRYFSMIEPILEKNGIPQDFKFVAVAESSLNPESYSVAKAAGLWQLLSTTAQESGLEVNTDVDERYHIEKSTEVACKYFKRAKERFGSWTMAAASYNVGIAGLARRAESQGQKEYYNLFLPTETMRYVFRILTFKSLASDPPRYGFSLGSNDYYKPFTYKEIEVNSPKIIWSDVAEANNTNYKLLRELNPWIRSYEHTNKLGKTYKVKVPTDGMRGSL